MYAVIRIRGSVNLNRDLKQTLKQLRLHSVNHLVLVPENSSAAGMLKKVEPFITYGEINAETLARLLEKRGCLQGDRKIDEKFLKANKLKGLKELAGALLEGKVKLQEIGVKPVFRLRPPRKGHERAGIKKSYSVGGAAGYRASDIEKLIDRML